MGISLIFNQSTLGIEPYETIMKQQQLRFTVIQFNQQKLGCHQQKGGCNQWSVVLRGYILLEVSKII